MSFTDTPSAVLSTAGRRTSSKHPTNTAHRSSGKAKKPSKAPKAATIVNKATGSPAAKTTGAKKGRVDQPKAGSAQHSGRNDRSPGLGSLRTGTKLAVLVDMLRRPKGVTLGELVEAIGWQAHSVRGAISGALKKKLGLTVESQKVEDRGRIYRIVN